MVCTDRSLGGRVSVGVFTKGRLANARSAELLALGLDTSASARGAVSASFVELQKARRNTAMAYSHGVRAQPGIRSACARMPFPKMEVAARLPS